MLPKSRRGVPARAVFDGRSVPVEIVNGSSGNEASFASGDEFASKEEDDERNPDEDITAAARFALGVAPSDKAWAAAARLPGAVVVRRALAALHNDTNKGRLWPPQVTARWWPKQPSATAVNPTRKPSLGPIGRPKGRATRGKKRAGSPRGSPTTLVGQPPRFLTANKDANVVANWQAEEGGHPSGEAGWASKRKANHAAHQGSGTRSPQGLMALFVPTADKNQGRTRQRGSAANFLPAPKKAGDTEAWLQAERVHEEKNQGKNGQGGSAANFLPAPRKA